jgi:triphosphoribosyl-dephospho-CoA synthase
VTALADSRRRDSAYDAYLWACELELRAYKPGNVSLHSEGHDMTVEDFRRSARASAPYLTDPVASLGQKIFRAVEATRDAVGCNTNLGIVLLAAPLIQAFMTPDPRNSLRDAVKTILLNTTLDDAEWVYRAIRLAQPGGLGEAPEQDVSDAPEVTLLETMQLAASRDSIARQYANYFADVFHMAVPLYHAQLSRWEDEEWAAVAVFVGIISRYTDSHIERKFGAECSRQISNRMTEVGRVLFASPLPRINLDVLKEVDLDFKSRGINPGTTADLTVATLLAARLENQS